MSLSNPKFQMYKSGSDYRYRLKSKSNGENILYGEGYSSKQACQAGIASVKTNAPYDSRYEKRSSINGKYFFNLKASNGETIGVSEMYNSTAARDNGIAAVKRDAPTAPIEDLT